MLMNLPPSYSANSAAIPAIGFAAFSGAGKTTLLSAVIPELKSRGIRLGVIKHAHHSFEIDVPGKDSHVLRHSGADQVLVASRYRQAWVIEHDQLDHERGEPKVEPLIEALQGQPLDLIIVEGFKHAPITKIEIHRPILGHRLMALQDRHIVAVATDRQDLNLPPEVDTLDLNHPLQVAQYVYARVRRSHRVDTQSVTLKAVDAE